MVTPPVNKATSPRMLRIVRAVAGNSLVVALPLPTGLGAAQQSSSSNGLIVAAAMPTHDSAFWQKFSKSPVLLKISKILRGLGLRQLNSGPGKILFQHNVVDQLADGVADAVNRLPATTEELIAAAADYTYTPLQEEIAQLLHRFGENVWGATRERTWLLKASESNEEYQRDLKYEKAEDKVV